MPPRRVRGARPRPRPAPRLRAVPAGLLAALALTACATPRQAELPPWEPVPEPAADAVESVVFLIGDPGVADWQRAPILSEIANDVERWAGELGADSAVAVLVLGDIV